jgi:cyclopropane fatty-acyl-phospholipid synthase-like methyltransferase
MRANAGVAYPLTARYDPDWIRENALGENALCQAESLSRRLPLRSGMRVLDLACGNATSSIFLAREFGVEVWAADLWVSPSDNRQRAIEFGCERSVFPLRVEAHDLPFAENFFDAVVAIDSYLYFGTDERYLSYLLKFVKPGGHIGVVDIGFRREIDGIADAPDFLREHYPTHWSFVHCTEWWRKHWEKTGLVEIVCAEFLEDSENLLGEYVNQRQLTAPLNPIMWAVPRDNDGLLALFRLVARKR